MHKPLAYLWLCLLATLTVVCVPVRAQQHVGVSGSINKRDRLMQLVNRGQALLEASKPDSVIALANQAYQLALTDTFLLGQAKSEALLAQAYRLSKDYPQALSHYLPAMDLFAKLKMHEEVFMLTFQTGLLYSKWEVHSKAVEYFRMAHDCSDDINKQLACHEHLGDCFSKLGQPDSAAMYYTLCLDEYRKQGYSQSVVTILQVLSDLYLNDANYTKALEYQFLVLEQYQSNQDNDAKIAALNNIGFLYKRLKLPGKSLIYFEKALEACTNRNKQSFMLTNIGVIHYNQDNNEKAMSYFYRALKLAHAQHDLKAMARNYNLLASIAFKQREYQQATDYASLARDIGISLIDGEILLKSFDLMAQVYEANGYYELALDHYKLYALVKDSLNVLNREKKADLLSKQYFIEKSEKELKLFLAEKDIHALAMKQLLLEKEKQEKELVLEREKQAFREREYQLEKATATQRLKILSQNLEAEKKDLDILRLNKDKKIKDLALKQEETEKKEKIKEIELLKKAKKLKELEAERQRIIRNFLLALIVIVGLILALLWFNFIKKRKLNRMLSLQNDEISQQKEEIQMQTEELRTTNEHLLELDNFKQAMTGMVVHDLKNPLNTILNTAGDNRIKNSANQMLTMVMNLLDIQKFEDAAMHLEKTPIQLAKLADDALEQVSVPAKEKNILLANEIGANHAVLVDAPIVERVLVNLATNAIKFSPNNGTIRINAYIVGGGYLRIGVKDQGPGISKENQKLIFEKFGQVSARNSGMVRSTGLGLTFCKMAVEAHGGEIGVESDEGQGSEFWLHLEIAQGYQPKDYKKRQREATALPELSEQATAQLAHFVDQLKTVKFYQASKLRKLIKELETPNEETANWKGQLTGAISAGNKDLFEKLINVASNGK